jgi:hypothetical protein
VPSNYYKKVSERKRSALILCFTWECLSSKPDKRPKRKECLIKPWSPAFKNRAPAKPNAPSLTCSRSDLSMLKVVRGELALPSCPDGRLARRFFQAIRAISKG